jgi:hypothetical protein
MNAADRIGISVDRGSMTMKDIIPPGALSPAQKIANLVPAGKRYGYGSNSIVPFLVQSLQAKVVPTIACAAAAPPSRRRSRARPGQ